MTTKKLKEQHSWIYDDQDWSKRITIEQHTKLSIQFAIELLEKIEKFPNVFYPQMIKDELSELKSLKEEL